MIIEFQFLTVYLIEGPFWRWGLRALLETRLIKDLFSNKLTEGNNLEIPCIFWSAPLNPITCLILSYNLIFQACSTAPKINFRFPYCYHFFVNDWLYEGIIYMYIVQWLVFLFSVHLNSVNEFLHKAWSRLCRGWCFCRSFCISEFIYRFGNYFWSAQIDGW